MEVKGLLGLATVGVAAMLPTCAAAQEKVEASAGADVVSSYIWRGQKLGEAAVQPSLGISYKGLSLSAWGSYGITNGSDNKEFDLTLSYSTGGFTIGVTDYFITNSGHGDRYFMYEAHRTAHTFEANIGYDFGPVALNWFTNFAGLDGVDDDGDRAYSSYFELSAPFRLGGLEWTAAVGFVPWETTFYADASSFAVTNVTVKAAKEIRVTDRFSLPLFAAISANPSSEQVYLTAGLSF